MMALIYLTGIETAGKSTTCIELKKRGFEAYDIDQGIAQNYNKKSGKKIKWEKDPTKRTKEWAKQHDFIIDRVKVKNFKQAAINKPIFLCGTTRNDHVVLDLFDKVIYLYLDEHTLKQRLMARQPNQFGSIPYEREQILGWHKSSEDNYRKFGAIMIDANQPLDKEVDAIVEAGVHQ